MSLEKRRKIFYIIQTYKILSGIDQVDNNIWFRTEGTEIDKYNSLLQKSDSKQI